MVRGRGSGSVGPCSCVGRLLAAGGLSLLLNLPGASASARMWKQLAADGVHDPNNNAIRILQEPQEALQELPPAAAGDQVDWVSALRESRVAPRASIQPAVPTKVLDLDVLMKRTHGLAYVKFSHRTHAEWLECSTCHDEIFKPKTGVNPRSMAQIALGNSCGRCHGTVAFPLNECGRCHNVPRAK